MTARPITIIGFAGLILVLVGLLAAAAHPVLESAWLRNLGGRTLLFELQGGSDCNVIAPAAVGSNLDRALKLAPSSIPTQRMLLRIKGLTRRGWIPENTKAGPAVSDTLKGTYRDPLLLLYSTRMSSSRSWEPRRCLAAWGAWTAALTEAATGNWEAAVTQYQAGLGLAPGRIPKEILAEYYTALARHALSTSDASAQRLAAAKYLALAGETTEAASLFAELAQDNDLDARGRCEAAHGSIWIQTGGERSGTAPSWLEGAAEAPCAAGDVSHSGPEWALTQHKEAVNTTSDGQLIGFDLDKDVLEAGAEVLGVLYWQRPDGSIERRTFRQPNLWPNSATSWLLPDGFDQCVPGYTEPDWVEPCAGEVVSLPVPNTRLNAVGKLYNAAGMARIPIS